MTDQKSAISNVLEGADDAIRHIVIRELLDKKVDFEDPAWAPWAANRRVQLEIERMIPAWIETGERRLRDRSAFVVEETCARAVKQLTGTAEPIFREMAAEAARRLPFDYKLRDAILTLSLDGLFCRGLLAICLLLLPFVSQNIVEFNLFWTCLSISGGVVIGAWTIWIYRILP